MNTLAALQDHFRSALSQLTDGDIESLVGMVTQAQDLRFGDYQANCAMSLGKRLGQPPREIAQRIIDRLDLGGLCGTPEVAGPGFINLRISNDWLVEQLEVIRHDDRLGVARTSSPRTYVVDFSSPNVAKPMHVGHIRSTVIGDALCRTLRFLGHSVVSDNHLGDWGTQFGMIIYGYRHFVDRAAYAAHPVEELGRVYRQVRQLMDFHEAQDALPKLQDRLDELQARLDAAEGKSKTGQSKTGDAKADKKAAKQHSKLKEEYATQSKTLALLQEKIAKVAGDPRTRALARQHADIGQAVLRETAKLHSGDPGNRQLWEEFLPKCGDEIERVYRRLDVTFDEELGESFYHDRLPKVVKELEEKGLAQESEGAMCVFLEEFDSPMIVRKQDGAYLYATTDLATIAYRTERWNPDAVLYVVDFRQSDHFRKLFATARAWGYDALELRHISFGTVLGEDGKPFQTRSGETVSLEALLDEAVARAHRVVSQNDDEKKQGPELSTEERAHIANVIGHAAIKYADLSQNRTSDYVFSFDKMVAMQGNTATYLQYSYARIRNIFSRGNIDIASLRQGPAPLVLRANQERALALQVLQLEESLAEMLVDYRPNLLANYLYQLSKRFAEFYEACPVLKAEERSIRDSRLVLCDLIARTMKLGLSLLGIQVIDKM